jgi:hypothetical protein
MEGVHDSTDFLTYLLVLERLSGIVAALAILVDYFVWSPSY